VGLAWWCGSRRTCALNAGVRIQGLKERAILVKELLLFTFELGSERLKVRPPKREGMEASLVVVLKSPGY
jgi:hypothetical protein